MPAFALASSFVKRPFSLGGGQGGIFHGEDCKCSVVASLRLSGPKEKSSPRSRKQTHAEIRKKPMNKERENERKKRDSLHHTKNIQDVFRLCILLVLGLNYLHFFSLSSFHFFSSFRFALQTNSIYFFLKYYQLVV